MKDYSDAKPKLRSLDDGVREPIKTAHPSACGNVWSYWYQVDPSHPTYNLVRLTDYLVLKVSITCCKGLVNFIKSASGFHKASRNPKRRFSSNHCICTLDQLSFLSDLPANQDAHWLRHDILALHSRSRWPRYVHACIAYQWWLELTATPRRNLIWDFIRSFFWNQKKTPISAGVIICIYPRPGWLFNERERVPNYLSCCDKKCEFLLHNAICAIGKRKAFKPQSILHCISIPFYLSLATCIAMVILSEWGFHA